MSDPVTRMDAALQGRYRIEREIGEGGMAVIPVSEGTLSFPVCWRPWPSTN